MAKFPFDVAVTIAKTSVQQVTGQPVRSEFLTLKDLGIDAAPKVTLLKSYTAQLIDAVEESSATSADVMEGFSPQLTWSVSRLTDEIRAILEFGLPGNPIPPEDDEQNEDGK
jgi:transcription termination factor NusB